MRSFGKLIRAKIAACAIASAMTLVASSHAAFADSWPSHTITAVIPLAAGSAVDVVGRIVLDQLSRQLGQPIVIENRAGGGGTLGVAAVAKAAPDGYTLLTHSSTFSASYSIYKSLPYDTFKDFTAVGAIGVQPLVLVAAPSKGWTTVADLVAAAKANPGKLNFASAGVGASSHLAAERFRTAAGIKAQHIPFRGPVEALTEVMSGRVDYYFLPVAPALSLVSERKLVALAVSTSKRATALPDVPTTSEAGLKDSAYAFWTGLFAPVKTPREIVGRLHGELRKALVVPSVQEHLAKTGTELLPMTRDEFVRYFQDDVVSTAKLVRQAGIPQTE